jgi:uncharacterized protein YndB with AHSA1/START domain
MASFDDATDTSAPPEDVFELLYDPEQFSRWWGCMQIEGNPAPTKHPDFGLPRVVSSSRGDGRVTVSCSLVLRPAMTDPHSHLVFREHMVGDEVTIVFVSLSGSCCWLLRQRRAGIADERAVRVAHCLFGGRGAAIREVLSWFAVVISTAGRARCRPVRPRLRAGPGGSSLGGRC